MIIVLTQNEINGPNCNIGYRQMWRVIQDKYQYAVKRFVKILMYEMFVTHCMTQVHCDDANENFRSYWC